MTYRAPCNYQSTATVSAFQAAFRVNSNQNLSAHAPNLSNVDWQDGNGNILSSSLENGQTNTSPDTVYRVNLGANIVPANDADYLQICQCNLRNQRQRARSDTGAKPQYDATYGDQDNCNQVFGQYGGGRGWSSFTICSGLWEATNGYPARTFSLASSVQRGAVIDSQTYLVTGSYARKLAFNYSTNVSARIGLVANAGDLSGVRIASRFVKAKQLNTASCLSSLNDLVAWAAQGPAPAAVKTNYALVKVNKGEAWSERLVDGFASQGSTVVSLFNILRSQ